MQNQDIRPNTPELKTESILNSGTLISTDVLIIGGAYAGLAALVALKNHLNLKKLLNKVSITLVEPKAGFLNILGVPRAIVDKKFSHTQYVPYEKLNDLKFDRLISNDDLVRNSLGKSLAPQNNNYCQITYVQGKVTTLTPLDAEYVLNNEDGSTNKISFRYAIIASGRDRKWPTSPLAYNYESYVDEMAQISDTIAGCKTIAVVGAGAVGIEVAGDIKTKIREIEVVLIHPHEKFPPEDLPDHFKDAVRSSLERVGVKVMTGYRVKSQTKENVLEFTNGESLKVDFTYWSNSFRNNTGMFAGTLADFVTGKNNVYVNDYLQLSHPESGRHFDHLFAIGDLVEIPIIKSAGWAMYMGRQVANNIVSHMETGSLVESMPDINKMPKGMVLVGGNNEIVSLLDGTTELNNPGYVLEYEDYCFGKVRATLGT